MNFTSGRRILNRLIQEKNKGVKNLTLFFLSRFLRYSRFCYFFTLKVGGCKIRFSHHAIPASIFVSGDLDPETTIFLQKKLRKGDVYIDIGANVGTTTLVAAKTVGLAGVVFCFEPNKSAYLALLENIKINNLNNVMAKQYALGSTEGTVSFSNNNNDDMNRIADSTGGSLVSVAILDSFSRHISGIRLIKIDVEGYEMEVLAGAVETLKKTDMVIFESIEKNAQKYGFKVSDLISFFRAHNFRIMETDLIIEHKEDEDPSKYPYNLVAINLLRQVN